ncbi:hypothetical protein [Kitasatospora sp. MBT63]|uniref:hypothetical protein n=1 Tax=Kitasatospora sp. MBT63 TaxID=1444768 RepID=UPI0011EA6614|nr:hypothetical protein [Kitasatospora sp. MBT63]
MPTEPTSPGRIARDEPPTSRERPTSTHHADFHPVVVSATTEHQASHGILASVHLRIVRADQVCSGDLIVSAFEAARPRRLHRTGYFAAGPYRACPEPYDPTCGCGVCGLPEVHGPDGTVVLTTGQPWNTCDPWPADDLVLIRPRRDLHGTALPSPELTAPPTTRT